MGLVYNKYPGEWHGPGSISNVIKDLNKLYQPFDDFQVLHFSDGMIYYDKIIKAAHQKPRKYLIDLMKKTDLSEEKLFKMQQMHTLFKKYTLMGIDQKVYPEISASYSLPNLPGDDDFNFDETERRNIGGTGSCSEDENWRNGVLLLISCRLGLRSMQEEYFSSVHSFFLSNFNCGIIGGRPKEAFYLVGIQEKNVILLDPHNTMDALVFDDTVLKQHHH